MAIFSNADKDERYNGTLVEAPTVPLTTQEKLHAQEWYEAKCGGCQKVIGWECALYGDGQGVVYLCDRCAHKVVAD